VTLPDWSGSRDVPVRTDVYILELTGGRISIYAPVLPKFPIIAIPKLLKVPEFVRLTAEKVPLFVSAPLFKVITILRMALLVSVPVQLRTSQVNIVPNEGEEPSTQNRNFLAADGI
jgi:hypothetical protein